MRRASLAALTLVGGAALYGAGALAQSASVLTATISQSLEADTNFDLDDPSPGTAYLGDTRFGLGYVRERSTDSLVFGFDTALRALDRADEPFEFTLGSPTGALFDYARENPNSELDAFFRYRQRRTIFRRDIEDLGDDPLLPIDPLDDNDELDADTREHRFDANIGAQFNTSAPSSYGLRFAGTAIDYSDDATDLAPRRFGEVEGDWTLRVNPVFSTIVAATYFQYDADNAQETEIRLAEVDAGVIYSPSENLRVRGGVGYADREREDTNAFGTRVTETNKGPTLRGDLRYELPSLTLFGDARLTTAAPQTRFAFSLRGTYELARGRLIGRVFNRYTGSTGGGDEDRVAGVVIGLERDLNSVSRIGLDLAYANEENLTNTDDPDISRTSATATYSYDLTRTITADVGYRFRNRTQDPEDADSHRVFLVIGRTFETGL